MNGCRPILSWALMFVIAPSLLRSGDTGRSPSIPRTPKQVFLPPLPPMRYVPGLEEPLVATGPVGLQETAALDAAIAAWKEAWRRGRDATAPQAKLLVDRAVGELAKMHARVGHDAELDALLADIGTRPLGGPGAQTVEGAREGLWAFRHNPDAAYLCGPKALKNLLVTLRAGTKQIETAEDARSGTHGFSLAELAALSDKAKLRYRLIFRWPGQPVPVPSIINWNVHHYAAITDMRDGRYLVNDPTFGDGGRALTEKAIDAEGSGYFLVPATVAERHADSGWRSVSPDSSEARTVYGMGLATGWTPGNTMFHDICIFCGLKNALNWLTNGTPQMTVANAHTMAVSLNLSDTPVGYRPQRGVPNMDRITYNSREAEQPANFSFSNMSANWTHSWQAYIEDNPQQANTQEKYTRSLTLTDPMGYTDYLYFYQNSSITPGSDPADTVPTGMPGIANTLLSWRNTYYWNKHAFALGVTMSGGVVTSEDFGKAALTHWYHWEPNDYAYSQISSLKQPLENRVWVTTFGAYAGLWNGTLDEPTAVGRVLDDGTSQVSKATYKTSTPNGGTTVSPWPLTRTDPKGRETQYTYAANNIDLLSVEQKTSASGFTTLAAFGDYNTQHEPQTYTGPDGQTWRYAYNASGQLTSVTDPDSATTRYNYDGLGRLETVVNANEATALTLSYDEADRVRTRTDSEGYTLTYDYDNLDRVTKITYPDGTTDLYDYRFESGPHAGESSLEVRQHTDRLQRVTTYGYDADRRLISVTEPIASGQTRTTRYDYYEDGTLKDIIDPKGNVTHWDIDIESRPIAKTYAYGTSEARTETYTYEKTTSRLHSVTDASGQVKTFTYGEDDRLAGITYTKTINPTPNVSFAYGEYFPRVTSMTDGSGTTTYSYYPAGGLGGLQLEKEVTPFTNGSIAYAYDPLARLASRTVDTSKETFAYDKLSRLITHGTALGSLNLTYLGQTNQITSQKTSSGTVGTVWTYEPNAQDRRLKSISNSGATRSFNFTTTPENLITQIQETAVKGSAWLPKTWDYSYDESYRLTKAASAAGTYGYGLDPADNITTLESPAGNTSASYNALNQIVDFGSHAYSYDKNGNLLDDGVRTYTWDAENRLLSVTHNAQPSVKTTFQYDGLGRRIAIDATNGTSTLTRYLWCGESLCQATTASGIVTRRYYPEGEYLPSGGVGLYYSQDQLGSVRDVLSAQSGSRTGEFDYDPYGNPIQSNGTGTDFRYGGLFYDQQDGVYLTHFRVYDPLIGMWLSRDPIGERGGINLHSYVAGEPITRMDQGGYSWHSWIANRILDWFPSTVDTFAGAQQSLNAFQGWVEGVDPTTLTSLLFSHEGLAENRCSNAFRSGYVTGMATAWLLAAKDLYTGYKAWTAVGRAVTQNPQMRQAQS